MNWVLDLKIVCNHRPHRLIVFREDGLEHREVVLCHLVSDLVENVDELGISGVLAHVEYWWLETLSNHVISIENFLWQNDKHRVDLLVVQEPGVL